MDIILETMGWAGAVVVLTAYGLISMQKLNGGSKLYQTMNISGSLMLAIYGFWKGAYASFAVNVLWLLIGLVAVTLLRRAREKA